MKKGKTCYVPENMTYEEWKKTLEREYNSGIINLNRTIQRKESNVDVFFNLRILMQKNAKKKG